MDWNDASQEDRVDYDPARVFAAGLALHHLANTAYPIGHSRTMRACRVPQAQTQGVLRSAWGAVDRCGLYVHIPFCEARCRYCEYVVLDPRENAAHESRYFDLLMREFALAAEQLDPAGKQVIGFDIGGGTPSAVDERQIGRVVEAARRLFALPEAVTVSIETTPKIAAREPGKLCAYHEMGIRRISMGIQTVSAELLERLGRDSSGMRLDHEAAEAIRAAGFERFNVDLMYGFADQSPASWEATLRHALDLDPEYITLYRMRFKGTLLAEQATRVPLAEVNAHYALASEMLKAAGYLATPGKNTYSRLACDPGTSDYLTERVIHGTPYLGLGLGAQSLSQHTLSYNSGAAGKNIEPYEKALAAGRMPIQDLYYLSRPVAMAKMISVSFYFGEIHRASFAEKFGLDVVEAFPAEVAFLLECGLMEWTPETLRLTAAGVEQMNGVIALFYAGAVKGYLIELADR